MAINFPSAPATGTVYEYGDYRYTFDGTKWTSVVKYGSSAVKIQSATPPGAPEPGLQWYDDASGRNYFWHINEGTQQGQWVEESPQGLVEEYGDVGLSTVTSTDSTTSRRLDSRFSDVTNVLDFGAVGDGIVDDTSAIESAISQGGEIYIPTGRYRITSRIDIASPTTIVGAGRGSTELLHDNSDGVFSISSSNVCIEGLSIESADRDNMNPVTEGFVYINESIENITIRDCFIGYFYQARGAGRGYCIFSKGQDILNLQIVDNHFERAVADDEGSTGLDGFCGFIAIMHEDSASFTTGVTGRIANNRFWDTENIPVAGTLRSDADAIRFYNPWSSSNWTDSDRVNSYKISITDNYFGLIQHIGIKMSGVGGLNISNNFMDNTQVDRYPTTPNTFGTLGEKDWQNGMDLRGGSFICSNNEIKCQAASVAVNGVIGTNGYEGMLSNNRCSQIPGQGRLGVAVVSTNMDNLVVEGNFIRGSSPDNEAGLRCVLSTAYHPSATVLDNLSIRDNTIINSGLFIIDVQNSRFTNNKVQSGFLSFRRVNACTFDGLQVTNTTEVFIADTGSTNYSRHNTWNNCKFRVTSADLTRTRVVELPANMDHNIFTDLHIICDSNSAITQSGFLLSAGATDQHFHGVHLEYNGDNAEFYEAWCRFLYNTHVGRLDFDINPTADNIAKRPITIHSSVTFGIFETLAGMKVTGNVANYGTNVWIGNLIGGFSIANVSGGTHTVVNRFTP